YETKTRRSARDLIMCSHEFPKFAGFRGNIFEDFAHKELQRGGKFRIRCLNNDSSEIAEIDIKELEYNWFMSLNKARKGSYNRPISKTFASIDSFSLNDETLLKGLKDVNRFLPWRKEIKNIDMFFVVPPEIFETFPQQKFKTAKDENYRGGIPEWANGITQYALEINLGIKKQQRSEENLKKTKNDK
ncbi:34019_t:CDS:2, partial [Gigaspora margarita]